MSGTQELAIFNSVAVKALSLSAQERAKLAGALLDSLQKEAPMSEDEQLRLVEERLQTYRADPSKSISYEELQTRLNEKYGI